MYEVAGIITFWVLRIGLTVFLVWFILNFDRFRQSITCSVQTSENTWTRRPLTAREAAREFPWWGWAVFIVALFLDVACWWVLFIV